MYRSREIMRENRVRVLDTHKFLHVLYIICCEIKSDGLNQLQFITTLGKGDRVGEFEFCQNMNNCPVRTYR